MNSALKSGTLYLIPTNLALPVDANTILPRDVIAIALKLDHYIAENAKTARAFLKAIGTTRPLQEISIQELNKHHDPSTQIAAICWQDTMQAWFRKRAHRPWQILARWW